MSMVKEFQDKMSKAVLRKDLQTLNHLSQEILDLINRPYTIKPFLKRSEVKSLNIIFERIAVYIVTLTVRADNMTSQSNIRRK